MADRCPQCGRETYASVHARLKPAGASFADLVDAESCSADSGFASDVEECADVVRLREAFERGRRAGMREAIEVVLDNVDVHDAAMAEIRAEVAKRCGDG